MYSINLLLSYMYRYGNVFIEYENYKYYIKLQVDGTIKIYLSDELGNFDNIDEAFCFDIDSTDFRQMLLLVFDDIWKNKKKILISYLDREVCRNTIKATNQIFRKIMSVFSMYPLFLMKIYEDCRNSLDTWRCFCPTDEIKNYSWNRKELSIGEMMQILSSRVKKINNMYATIIANEKENALKPDYEKKGSLYNMQNKLLDLYYEDEYYEILTLPKGLNYEFLDVDNNLGDDIADSEEALCKIEKDLIMNKNVLIIGEAGVGKTTLVSQFAKKISRGEVSKKFKYRRILKIYSSDIVSGCSLVGQLEQRVNQIISYLKANPDVILFIDEIHTIIKAGTGSLDDNGVASIFMPYLERNQIKIIGATTTDEYDEYIKPETAFSRRFSIVTLNEPNYDKLYNIIKITIENLAKKYEKGWNFTPEDEKQIIDTIIKITDKKHMKYDEIRRNPDASIEIIEGIFVNAVYLNHENIEISDVIDAIEKCEFLYEGAIKRLLQNLRKKAQPAKDDSIENPGVIVFRRK